MANDPFIKQEDVEGKPSLPIYLMEQRVDSFSEMDAAVLIEDSGAELEALKRRYFQGMTDWQFS